MGTPDYAVALVQRRRWVPMVRLQRGPAIAAAVIVALVLMALLAPLIAPYDPNQVDLSHTAAPAGAGHLLGTDSSGRDILSRLIWGARTSLLGPLLVVAISTLVGVPLGLLAGYRRGWVDTALSRAWDVMFAFPPLLMAIVIVAAFGAGFTTATIAIAIIYIPMLARVVRGVVLVERERAYVGACTVLGYSGMRICLRHVLPNVMPVIAAQSTLNFGYAILDLAGLTFLGLGVAPPTADWGQMLSNGRDLLVLGSYTEVVAASCAIAVSVVCFNVLGDALATRAREAA